MDINGHNYSGWPGAYCLYCGQEDPEELALGDVPEKELTSLREPCKYTKEPQ